MVLLDGYHTEATSILLHLDLKVHADVIWYPPRYRDQISSLNVRMSGMVMHAAIPFARAQRLHRDIGGLRMQLCSSTTTYGV